MADAVRRFRRRPTMTGRGGGMLRRGAGAAARGLIALARLVRLVSGVLAAVIVLAIVLRVAGANDHNPIISQIHQWGRDLVGVAHNLFRIKDPKLSITVNWGIAAVVYLLVGALLARVLTMMTSRGGRGPA
jgi:hypothetical protein